jgi:hypothetical protein
MTGIKQNLKIGAIEGLTGAEYKIIRKLIISKNNGQANWLLHKNLNLSIAAVSRAVRELQDRNVLLKKRGYAVLNPVIIKKLKEDG